MHDERSLKRRIAEIAALVPVGALYGTLFGVAINLVNSGFTLYYYNIFLNRYTAIVGPLFEIEGSLRALLKITSLAVREGTIEGLILSFPIALLFSLFVAFQSRLKCPFYLSFRYLLVGITMLWLFWIVGGINGVLIVQLWPDAFELFSSLVIYPEHKYMNYPWSWYYIIGSDFGIAFGMPFVLMFACLLFRRAWRRQLLAEEIEDWPSE